MLIASRNAPPPEKSAEELEEEKERALRRRAATEKLVKPFMSECPARFPMLSPYGPPLAGVLNTSLHVAKRDASIKPARLVTQLQLTANGDTVPLGIRTTKNINSAEFRQKELEQLQQQRMRAAMLQKQQQQQQHYHQKKSNNQRQHQHHGGGSDLNSSKLSTGSLFENNRDVPYSSNTVTVSAYNHQEAPIKKSWIEPSPENLEWAASMKSHQIREFGQLDRTQQKLLKKNKTLPKKFSETLIRRVLHFCDGDVLLDAAKYVCRHWHSLIVRDPILEKRMKTFSPPLELRVFLHTNNNNASSNNEETKNISQFDEKYDEMKKNLKKKKNEITTPFVSENSWPTRGIVGYLMTDSNSSIGNNQNTINNLSGTGAIVAQKPLTVVCISKDVGPAVPGSSSSSSRKSYDENLDDDLGLSAVGGKSSSILRMMSKTQNTSSAAASASSYYQQKSKSSLIGFPSSTLEYLPKSQKENHQNNNNNNNNHDDDGSIINNHFFDSQNNNVKKQSALRAAIISPPTNVNMVNSNNNDSNVDHHHQNQNVLSISKPFAFATPSQPYSWVGVDFGNFRVSPSSYCFRTVYRARPTAWQLQGTRDEFEDWSQCKWMILDARGGDYTTKFMTMKHENDEDDDEEKDGSILTQNQQQEKSHHQKDDVKNSPLLTSPLSSNLVHQALKRRFSMHSTRLGEMMNSSSTNNDKKNSPERKSSLTSDFGHTQSDHNTDYELQPLSLAGSAEQNYFEPAESASLRGFGRRESTMKYRDGADDQASDNLKAKEEKQRRNERISEFVWGHFEVQDVMMSTMMKKKKEEEEAAMSAKSTISFVNGRRVVKKNHQQQQPQTNQHQKVIHHRREGYKRLRIVQCGRNASWGLEMHMCGFEVYGDLSRK